MKMERGGRPKFENRFDAPNTTHPAIYDDLGPANNKWPSAPPIPESGWAARSRYRTKMGGALTGLAWDDKGEVQETRSLASKDMRPRHNAIKGPMRTEPRSTTPAMTNHVCLDADSLLALFEATLQALHEVDVPATKATLMHRLVRIIGDGPDCKVQELLRNAGVFVCALNVLTGLVPTLDPSDEDQTDVVETVCTLIRAATDGNQASQAAAKATGLGPILIDLARAGPTKFIRSAAGAALIAIDLPQ